jgi:hypothetical protein
VDVGRDRCRVVERTGANEPDLAARVLAEDRYLAGRATPDLLLLASAARHGDRLRLAGEELHSVGLDQQVDDECAPGLSLTVQAMTAMREERVGCEPVADRSARAATLKWGAHDLLQAGMGPRMYSPVVGHSGRRRGNRRLLSGSADAATDLGTDLADTFEDSRGDLGLFEGGVRQADRTA